MGQSRATGIKLLCLSGCLFRLSVRIWSVDDPRSLPLVILLPLSVVPAVLLMMVRYVVQRLD